MPVTAPLLWSATPSVHLCCTPVTHTVGAPSLSMTCREDLFRAYVAELAKAEERERQLEAKQREAERRAESERRAADQRRRTVR